MITANRTWMSACLLFAACALAGAAEFTQDVHSLEDSYSDSRRASEMRTAPTGIALARRPTKADPSPNKGSYYAPRKLEARGQIDGPSEMVTRAQRGVFELVIRPDPES